MIRKHTVGSVYKTNLDGDVELIEHNGKTAIFRFLNTGYECEALIANVVAGKCRDHSVTERVYSETTTHNAIMQSNNYGEFILLERTGKHCVVQFIKTGYTTKCLWENIKLGKIADPYLPTTYNLGYMGEYKKTSYWKQALQLWRNMLKRCYSEKDPKGYFGKGITVDTRWLCFANFLQDLPKLQNFNLWLEGQRGHATKYNLDKDFIVEGNKVYSREVCMFLTEAQNKSLGGMKRVDKA